MTIPEYRKQHGALPVEEIRRNAQLQFQPYEVCVRCDLPDDAQDEQEFQDAYMRGKLDAQAAVRSIMLQGIRDGDRTLIKGFMDLCDKNEVEILPEDNPKTKRK